MRKYLCVLSLSPKRVYEFDPLPKKLPAAAKKRILGGECMMWTEHAPRNRIESKLYPRVVAFAERLWSPEKVPFEDFPLRLKTHYRRLELLGVDYGRETAEGRE